MPKFRYMRQTIMIGLLLNGFARAQVQSPESSPVAAMRLLRDLVSVDERFHPALTAVENHDFEEAYSNLAYLLRESPGNEAVNFAFGMMAVQRNRPSLGALALERVLTINPENDRARLELARVYFATGQWERARQQFHEVLARRPPPGVRDNIEAYLRGIRRYRPGWSIPGRIEIGGLYDSNVNFGPDSRTIRITPLTIGDLSFDELLVARDNVRQSAWGGMAAVTLRPTYEAWQAGGLSFDSHVRLYANGLLNASDYAIAGAQAGGGPRWRSERQTLHIPLRVEHIDRGGSSLATLTGVHPQHHYRIDHAWSLIGGASAEIRNFSGSSNRDSLVFAAAEQVAYRFGDMLRHHAAFGLRLARETARDDIYSHTELDSNFRLHLWMSSRQWLYTGASLRYRTYDEREVLAPGTRRDVQWGIMSGITRYFNDRWSTDLVLQYTETDSSFDLYDTTRFNASWSIIHDF